MSFAVWKEKPPFVFVDNDSEQIYPVGSVWVVTDDETRATQAEVDAVLNQPAPKSEAASMVEKIANDPAALAALKAGLK